MEKHWYILLFLWCAAQTMFSQELPLQLLEEVTVSDMRLKRYAEGHKVTELKDSVLQRNGLFLTSLLSFNSNIYFKENGLGMVSSPAFRGTNASHTAVVWNGININSQLNGQTDFNTINPFNYSSVAVRSGGGNVQFGSGAIGGSVHLNNDLGFHKHFENQVITGYGSFDTRSLNYRQSYGTGKWSSNFGINYNRSDNDYKYLETNERNRNGAFEHLNLNFNAGRTLSEKQVLRLYHQSFVGDRQLSGTLVAPGRGRYEDNQHRTQLEWGHYSEKVIHTLKLAHLYEGFKFFENRAVDRFSEGRVTTLLARYAMDVALSPSLRVHSFLEFNHFRGRGNSFGRPLRNDASATAILKHSLSENLQYNLSVRQDVSSDFASPLVFALSGRYALSDFYALTWNASRNVRMPTFNDLYWQPGGNLELRPERSYQLDVGQRFAYGPFSAQLNGYYINTNDMIRWLPNNSAFWSPINVDAVNIYGAELELGGNTSVGENQEVELQARYAYTVSQDRESGEQLIYVPFHSGNLSLAYHYAQFGVFYQHRYNGPVSIIGGQLEGHQVANAGVGFSPKSKGKLAYRIAVTVNNVFNAYYENIAFRPMPNRNIQTQFILNF
ncbi:TonB-dependent receptor plug domain-containing protein [Maribacter sp. 2307ULW6-5]|uniref:TonB-dependent receptor plug domain-containing protein n=1 Tax=Maribacter sp. 2307ULW6-5 TaxID=3386275 RepID=UPI0039BC8326